MSAHGEDDSGNIHITFKNDQAYCEWKMKADKYEQMCGELEVVQSKLFKIAGRAAYRHGLVCPYDLLDRLPKSMSKKSRLIVFEALNKSHEEFKTLAISLAQLARSIDVKR